MPLPSTPPQRTLKHRRSLSVEFYKREDDLWDIDARLTDVKTYDVAVQSNTGILPANKPIHDLLIRLTVDNDANIVGAVAVPDAVPFAGFCETIGPAYQKLIGLNVINGFRQTLRERFAGVAGCTHLNELAMIIPDAAVQVFAFENRRKANTEQCDKKPFELDKCHALRTDGAAVAVYYPRWAVQPAK